MNGDETDVIVSLAGLAEKLTRRKMDEEERWNPNLVVAALKLGIDERDGRWLLCLDNADDSSVSRLLNEECWIGRGERGDEWVGVTSGQAQPHISSEMASKQKFVLEPLCVKDAIAALWRQARKMKTDVADCRQQV